MHMALALALRGARRVPRCAPHIISSPRLIIQQAGFALGRQPPTNPVPRLRAPLSSHARPNGSRSLGQMTSRTPRRRFVGSNRVQLCNGDCSVAKWHVQRSSAPLLVYWLHHCNWGFWHHGNRRGCTSTTTSGSAATACLWTCPRRWQATCAPCTAVTCPPCAFP